MPRKPTPAKKAAASASRKPAKPAAARPKAKSAPAANNGLYVAVASARLAIGESKSALGGPSTACRGFDEAKLAAIDGLIAAIEDAERKLTACKRATTLEDLRAL